MKPAKVEVYYLEVPFKKSFEHASSKRDITGNLITKVILKDGTVGYGEGVPREYVTGETPDSATRILKKHFIPKFEKQDFTYFGDCVEWFSNLKEYKKQGVVYNSAKCSLELAALDAYGKLFERPVSYVGKVLEIKKEQPQDKHYSYIFSLNKKINKSYALILYGYGFRDFKFKINKSLDLFQIVDFNRHLRRRITKGNVTLRVDANESLEDVNIRDVKTILLDLEKLGVTYFEQPFKKGSEKKLKDLKYDFIPIMLDESLCSVDDVKRAIDEDYVDAFNLRISKNGGIIQTLKIRQLAVENNYDYQLGCMVGETGILSAAGRHFVNIVSDALFVEGSYGTHLLQEDITQQNMTFRFGAKIKPLQEDGLGIDIDEEVFEKYALKITD